MFHYAIYAHTNGGRKLPYCFFTTRNPVDLGDFPSFSGENVWMITQKIFDEGIFRVKLEAGPWIRLNEWLKKIGAIHIHPVETVNMKTTLNVRQFSYLVGNLTIEDCIYNPMLKVDNFNSRVYG